MSRSAKCKCGKRIRLHFYEIVIDGRSEREIFAEKFDEQKKVIARGRRADFSRRGKRLRVIKIFSGGIFIELLRRNLFLL